MAQRTTSSDPQDPPAAPPDVPGAAVYARLAAPFDSTFRDNRGGVELEYITGEQVVSRLNDVLGVAAWSFRVLQHGINVEADEAWALGEITAEIDTRTVVRQQWGSQKLKRSRSTGAPLDIGFDLKGSGTDALKKCASLLGVGLYLSKKEQPGNAFTGGETRADESGRTGTSRTGTTPATPTAADSGSSPTTSEGPHACDVCGAELKETKFKDGTTWGPTQLAAYGRRKHGRILCMIHYREANEARKSVLLSV
jgi:Rad52/22 family double-strand break repair protein